MAKLIKHKRAEMNMPLPKRIRRALSLSEGEYAKHETTQDLVIRFKNLGYPVSPHTLSKIIRKPNSPIKAGVLRGPTTPSVVVFKPPTEAQINTLIENNPGLFVRIRSASELIRKVKNLHKQIPSTPRLELLANPSAIENQAQNLMNLINSKRIGHRDALIWSLSQLTARNRVALHLGVTREAVGQIVFKVNQYLKNPKLGT